MLIRSFGGSGQARGRLEALGSLPCWSESGHQDCVCGANGCNGQMLPKHEQGGQGTISPKMCSCKIVQIQLTKMKYGGFPGGPVARTLAPNTGVLDSIPGQGTRSHTWCCSVTQSCPTLCDPMDCTMPGFPVLHHFLEFAQTHVHRINATCCN